MYKLYLKQAWQMLKEDKVISIITILGTALAITMIMVIILTQRIKTTNIGAETNRDRSLYISRVNITDKKTGGRDFNGLDINSYKQYLSRLTTSEKISAIRKTQQDVNAEGSDMYIQADIKYTDAAFWNIYSLSFLQGKPFSDAEFQSGIPVAVISKSMARKLFNYPSQTLGKTFIMNKKPYKVIGITEDVPILCKYAYAQIWVPYTTDPSEWVFTAVFLAKTKADFANIKSEVRRSEAANNPQIDEKDVRFWGPYSDEELLLKTRDNSDTSEPDLMKGQIRFYLTLVVLLLIPAINLSGFSLFKVLNRTSEIGIRKAFGANKKTILMQILYENLLTSIIGGIIGLVLSMITIGLVKDQLFGQSNYWEPQLLGENTIPVSAFISPWIFVYVFLACVLLNLLSSGIPAWRASKLNIVEAIKN